MFENPLVWWACAMLIPMLLAGLLGALIAWFLRPKHAGDLNVEGEARLRKEADELRAKLRAAEAEQVTLVEARDTQISDLKGKLAAAAAGAAAGAVATKAGAEQGAKDDEDTYALEWRNRYLAARVKYLEGRLADAPEAKPAKAKAKKAPAKKKAAKTAVAGAAAATAVAATKTRKKPGPKPGTKRGATNKDGSPRKKPGPKASGAPKKSDAELALDKYYANVKKFDGRAQRDVVKKVVSYCGVSLKSRDTSLVACSDPKEKDRIVKGFATKKLGITNIDERRQLVEDICAEMKATRQKSRVTFYYLMAKRAGKLDVFGG